jgi:predicted lysophospholipase L1 biosynthesis ABC-type transport system permease subunit
VGAQRVALINNTAAEKFFPGENPIGKRLRPYVTAGYQTSENFVEIVGVVADVPYGRLEEAIGPDVYVSALQPTDRMRMLTVRSSLGPAELTATVRREVLLLDRNVPLTNIQTMHERAAEVTSRTRFIAIVMGLFAGLAVLMAGVGIYGVMAYSVSARTRELGIRMALGAQGGDVILLVLKGGMSLAGIGIGVGLLASLALTRLMKGLLFGVGANDPLTFGTITLLLLAVAGLACWLPARRATNVDPLVAVRCD